MVLSTREILIKMTFTVMASIRGQVNILWNITNLFYKNKIKMLLQMEDSIMVNGAKTKCMEKEK
jgi:hypothetical protein